MEFGGVLPVLQLPYHDDESIDWATLRKEIDWNFQCGVSGVVIAMVTEVLRLSDAERTEVVRHVVEYTAGRGPVIASIGDESIRQVLGHAERAAKAGAHAYMAIPPALTRCGADEVVRYYTAILQHTSLPLVIQDASGYVGNAIPIAVQAELYRGYPGRVMFKPEATPFGPNISALRAAVGPEARIFEGTGGVALMDSYPRGINGTMPGAEIPWALVKLWQHLEAGRLDAATRIHEPLAVLVSMMTNLDSFLAMEKLFLHQQGIFPNRLVRGPVGCRLDAGTEAEMLRLFARLQAECR
jgi:4-hydroxy-tetrahydrodipicolinate synthase